MTTQILSSIDDLRIYLGTAFDLDRDDAQTAAEALQARSDRPDYGDDWAAYLAALEPDDVHSPAPGPHPSRGASSVMSDQNV